MIRYSFSAAILFLLVLSNSFSAPARAIYYTDDVAIKKLDPQTLESTTIFANAISAGIRFETLQIDAENGHLYWIDSSKRIHRGNIDGTGATEIHRVSGSLPPKDLKVNPATGQLFFGVERSGVYELDVETGAVTAIPQTPDPFELVSPHLYFEPDSDVLYWSDVSQAVFWRKSPDSESETLGQLPVAAHWGGTRGHSTDLAFDENGIPTPYTLARNGGSYFMVVGGLGEEEAQVYPTENIVPNPSADVAVDEDGGFVYFGGGTFGDETLSGVFRMNLDGTELVRLVPTSTNRISIAIDIVDLSDTDPPAITIFSPIGGDTNNQAANIIGSITDVSTITSATWSHNGVDRGAVNLFNGDFTVSGISLVPGANVLEIFATDLAGNSDSAQVTLNWQPLRAVTITNNASVREGRRTDFDVLLDSSGEVAGMTFSVLYDANFFQEPKVIPGSVIDSASPTINILTPGEIKVTFADPSNTVPEGEQLLVTVKLRARSVPAQTNTGLSVNIQDMADTAGSPIVIGTFAGTTALDIVPRTFLGDSNSNDRLDTGDATRMQAMLAGIEEKRAWDETINDLNGSTTLDSGDVIRVLRAVVGIDPQPSLPGNARRRSVSNVDPDAPRARLNFSEQFAAAGEQITVEVEIENNEEAFSGASFTLDYPVEALRLESQASHSPGTVVGGDAFLLWNLAPSQNDYANQSGSITLGASSSSSWPGSVNGGTLARFTFTVQPAASSQPLWPITIRNAEISTDSGFEIISLTGETDQFIGAPQTFASWSEIHFNKFELTNSAISGWDSDADGDRASNAIEFFTGTDPRDPDSVSPLAIEIVPGENGSHCLNLSYPRSLTAVGIDSSMEISSDLITWSLPSEQSVLVSELNSKDGTEQVTHQFPTSIFGKRVYGRLRVQSSSGD